MRSDPVMYAHVRSQRALGAKAASALPTGVRTYATMYHRVLCQFLFLLEGFRAYIASERFRIRMTRVDVRFELVFAGKALSTLVAREWFEAGVY